ncbi:HNH endonuclease [Chitinispirillales bacterium ANBcel5]|uniref:HNH endonuclease n=1 Tax=Cellulosispirillum alkaliphilum TaxID=3039283 RepID=UPI002A52445E|nr:HNH endonuclease [Chitinispirillales bacterium ANBcel5]
MAISHWQEYEFYLAMHLYYRTPFGRQHQSNPEIIELANVIGRTPGSVSMRLNNFSAYDPKEKLRNVKGLEGGGKACKSFWDKFHSNLEEESIKAEALWEQFVDHAEEGATVQPNAEVVEKTFKGLTESNQYVKVRKAQNFFRRAILSLYGNKCCITGLPMESLLIASHIRPWAMHHDGRVDPANGLCLSAIHDAAFDRGLITFDDKYLLVLSKQIVEHLSVEVLNDCFKKYEGKPISLPEKNLPDQSALKWHRNNLFEKKQSSRADISAC